MQIDGHINSTAMLESAFAALAHDEIKRVGDLSRNSLSPHDIGMVLYTQIPRQGNDKRMEYVTRLLDAFVDQDFPAMRWNIMHALEAGIPSLPTYEQKSEVYSRVVELLADEDNHWVRDFGRRVLESAVSLAPRERSFVQEKLDEVLDDLRTDQTAILQKYGSHQQALVKRNELFSKSLADRDTEWERKLLVLNLDIAVLETSTYFTTLQDLLVKKS